MFDEQILLCIRDVAKLLGVSERAVWGWAADGSFPPAIKMGRLRRWRRVDIDTWLGRQADAAKGVSHDPR